MLHTLVGQKLSFGKKIHTKYVKIYGAIVVIAVVHVDFSFMDSDLVTRGLHQLQNSFNCKKPILISQGVSFAFFRPIIET